MGICSQTFMFSKGSISSLDHPLSYYNKTWRSRLNYPQVLKLAVDYSHCISHCTAFCSKTARPRGLWAFGVTTCHSSSYLRTINILSVLLSPSGIKIVKCGFGEKSEEKNEGGKKDRKLVLFDNCENSGGVCND